MSFETIVIYRDFPIKNGYVQLPPNYPYNNTQLTREEALSIDNSKIVRLSLGSGKPTGSKHGQQEFLRINTYQP